MCLATYFGMQFTEPCVIVLPRLSHQRRKRNIIQRGKAIFPDFFPSVKCFFLVENSHFGRPKTNFSRFESEKQKNKNKKTKQKKVLSSFYTFSSFHFQFSTFPFSIFLLFFSIFPFFRASFFLVGLQKFPGEKCQGGTLPPGYYATVGHSSVNHNVKYAVQSIKYMLCNLYCMVRYRLGLTLGAKG